MHTSFACVRIRLWIQTKIWEVIVALIVHEFIANPSPHSWGIFWGLLSWISLKWKGKKFTMLVIDLGIISKITHIFLWSIIHSPLSREFWKMFYMSRIPEDISIGRLELLKIQTSTRILRKFVEMTCH